MRALRWHGMSELRPPVPLVPSSGSFPAESSVGPATLMNPRSCPTCGGRYPADFKVCPRDATPLEDAAPDTDDPTVGQLLSGTYEVLRIIGEGGMGRVYEAKHTRLPNKHFAIKMLHQELARQPEVMMRFQREAEASSGLSHPNVVSVFDVNTSPDGRPYIVAELLEGTQLGDHLDRVGKLPVEEAVPIVRQICRALKLAHERGVVHRDIKPENVFLSAPNAVVKVLDFGISKVEESQSSLTKTGVVMGTPDYMAPEQARGDRVDARADVYAVGAILYRALTGRKPFEGLDPMATLTAALVQEPPRPSSVESSIPLGVELVVQHAMAKEPRERFQSIAELDEALAPFDPGGSLTIAVTAPGPVDVSGRTVLSQPGMPSPTQLSRGTARQARLARPGLALFTFLGALWVIANAVAAVAAVIRQLRGGELTPSETVLIPLGTLAAVATPLVLWIRYVLREVWQSTPRAMDLGARLRVAVLYSASAYGLVALLVVLFESVLQRTGEELALPGWALLEASLALAVGGVTWGLGRRQHKPS